MTHENKTERISPMQNDGDHKDSFRFPHLLLSTFPHPLSRLPRELNRRLEAPIAKGTSIDE